MTLEIISLIGIYIISSQKARIGIGTPAAKPGDLKSAIPPPIMLTSGPPVPTTPLGYRGQGSGYNDQGAAPPMSVATPPPVVAPSAPLPVIPVSTRPPVQATPVPTPITGTSYGGSVARQSQSAF